MPGSKGKENRVYMSCQKWVIGKKEECECEERKVKSEKEREQEKGSERKMEVPV